MVHPDGRDAQTADIVGSFRLELQVADGGVVGARNHAEVGPELVVEEVAPQHVEGLGQGVDLHGLVGAAKDVLGEEGQGADVIQV